jgi:4-aminobutyrate aminotransferase
MQAIARSLGAGRRCISMQAKSTADHLRTLEHHFSPAVPRSPKGNDIVVDTAKGCWITSIEGKKYLDLQTGIGVANTGHCHPKVVAAIQEQAAKGIHLQQNCTISKPVVALLERLDKVTPPEISRFFFNGEQGGKIGFFHLLSLPRRAALRLRALTCSLALPAATPPQCPARRRASPP